MELGERKLRILQALIDDYIATAVPVGSRTISRKYLEWSSATIRNEMSDLEELGYLAQPHISAGRIPSDKAYRLYVDRMMHLEPLTEAEALRIRSYLGARMEEVDDVITQAARILAETTNLTSVVARPQVSSLIIRHMHLVPITAGLALMVLVTDAGIVKDNLLRTGDMDDEQLHTISRMLDGVLTGKTVAEAIACIEQEIGGRMQKQRLMLESLSEAFMRNLSADAPGHIVLEGTSNIFNFPEYNDIEKARSFLAMLETKDTIYKILEQAKEMEFSIRIGTENTISELQNYSLVTATYRIGGKTIGSMGVIGPKRMQYGKIASILNYLGMSLSEILSGHTEIP